ncbi:MAG: U32 family peptidase [Lentisphaeria bacterium]|nr:U32 family peptidase [Lentisphaeria bacterium]
MSSNFEIMAPGGDFASLSAALRSGADSVYIGVGDLNMRSHATMNFQPEELEEAVRLCRAAGKKLYLTINTIIFNGELAKMRELCDLAKKAGVNAVIASDFAVISYARSIGLSVHGSVQMNLSNLEAVRFAAQFADVVVLARELALEDIADICKAIKEEKICGPSGELLKIEIFIHGALCVAQSGRCFMSQISCNQSANRGRCFQPCRRKYEIKDVDSGTSFVLENSNVMSPKDLCMLKFLPELLASGASVFKIEGRGRSADYVANVVSVYREALDETASSGTLSAESFERLMAKLEKTFNRSFWHGGYYLGENMDEWSRNSGNQSPVQKKFLGRVTNFFARSMIAEITLEAGDFPQDANALITGKITGAMEIEKCHFMLDEAYPEIAPKGSQITFKVDRKVRRGDIFYLQTPRKFGYLSRDEEI